MLSTSDIILQLFPLLIVSVFLAWGNYLLAVKSGRSGVLFVILTLIPGIGFFTTWYMVYSSILIALDKRADS